MSFCKQENLSWNVERNIYVECYKNVSLEQDSNKPSCLLFILASIQVGWRLYALHVVLFYICVQYHEQDCPASNTEPVAECIAVQQIYLIGKKANEIEILI